MRNKKSLTTRDMYKLFVKDNYDVEYGVFLAVLEAFNALMVTSLIEESKGIKMPFGLGYVRIVKYKPKTMTDKSLSVDYKASNELGKRIYHLNEHSDGYKFRLYWSKVPQTFSARYKYLLCLVRQNKRKLALMIFNGHDYINADDIQIYKM